MGVVQTAVVAARPAVLVAVEGGEYSFEPSAAGGLAGLAWLIPLLPLLGFVLLVFAGRRVGEPAAGWLATGLVAGSFLLSVGVLVQLLGLPADARTLLVDGYTWIDIGRLRLTTDVLLDPLSATMLLVVTGVGSLVHLYSIGYMHGDARYARFFAYLNLFIFSMLVLVLAGNYVVLFVGWELVGLCSYLLIGFWFEEWPNAVAAKKAMIVNRVGDASFAVGLFLIFAEFGSLAFADVLPAASDVLGGGGAATAIGLLLLGGAVGKSAQIPLYVWLPDAMAGPTPVSALIHAATMVTAGVYMIARSSPIYVQSEVALTVVAVVGVATALLAALIAVQQDDIKKVLAYSTVSQLGYMFVGVGVGAFGAGIFHLVTHAFFKGLLFLAAGSVMHALADRVDMWEMGGLRRVMPVTFATAVVAWLAIAAVPPFAGFFSKDQILTAAYEQGHTLIWLVALVTTAITAFYMSRWLFVTFLGPERWRGGGPVEAGLGGHADPGTRVDAAAASPGPQATAPAREHAGEPLHPHESPLTMTAPLVVLAVLAFAGGLVNPVHGGPLDRWLGTSVAALAGEGEPAVALGEPVLIGLSVLAAAAGVALAYLVYLRPAPAADPLPARLGGLATAMRQKFWVDQAYEAVFVRGGGAGSRFLAWFDVTVIDGIANGTARATGRVAVGLRQVQTGLVRAYVAGLVLGAIALVAAFLVQVG
jgi:NADH-quinone oxidoreductase subunit L